MSHPIRNGSVNTAVSTKTKAPITRMPTTMTSTTTSTGLSMNGGGGGGGGGGSSSSSSYSNHISSSRDKSTSSPPSSSSSSSSSPPTTTSTTADKIHYYRNRLGQFVNHPYVQFLIIIFIAINSLMLGLATCSFVKDDPYVMKIFDTTDQIFLIIFTVELICQFLYLGIYLLRDPWLVFDLLLIVSSWVFQDLTIIRSFRIFRTLRLITRIKVMRNLVLALFSVVPRMIAIFLLLTLVSYIFAVMMTQLFKDLYTTETLTVDGESTVEQINYFGRLDASFLTLFQLMTLDGWADVANDVMMEHTWAWIPIIIYIIIAGFVVVNLVIAVICDAVSALKEDDKAKLHGTYHDTPGGDGGDDATSKTTHRRRRINNTVAVGATATATAAVPVTDKKDNTKHQRNVVIVSERIGNTDPTNVEDSEQHELSSPSIFPVEALDHPLTGLEQQVQELIQLQDATIQHVLSMAQQFQKTRMDLLSSSSTTTSNTASIPS